MTKTNKKAAEIEEVPDVVDEGPDVIKAEDSITALRGIAVALFCIRDSAMSEGALHFPDAWRTFQFLADAVEEHCNVLEGALYPGHRDLHKGD